MSVEEILVATRGAERLIISFGAILAIILGYKLFRIVAAGEGSAEGGFKGFTVKFERLAPGVFFALFGSAVLAWNLSHPVTYGVTASSGGNSAVPAGEAKDGWVWANSGGGRTESEENGQYLLAIASVLDLHERGKIGAAPGQESELDVHMGNLTRLQDLLVDRQYGAGAASKYHEMDAAVRSNPDKLKSYSAEEQQRYNDMRKLFAG